MNIFIISIFTLWRIGLFAAAFLGEKILPFAPRFPYSDTLLIPSGLPGWLWSFANFDGVHYLTISQAGYTAQFTQVFFPLYPMLMAFLRWFLPVSPIVIGLFISNLFLVLSMYVFAKLLSLDYKKDVIRWTLLFLLVFPTSFFFGSIYTESLFLFLILSSFYAARRGWWTLSAVLSALASATRLIGIFMLPALWWERYKEKGEKFNFFTPLTLIPVGLLSYMLYLQVKFGDFLYFWHAQPVFGAERSGGGVILYPQVIFRYLKIFTTVPVSTESFWIPMLEFASATLVFVFLFLAYRKKIRVSYLLFSFLSVITPTFTGTFSSMPRYILVAFPMFMYLGMLKSKLAKSVIAIFCAVLLVVLTILFTRGHWVS